MEIGADALLKATKVDGIYDRDPKLHRDAKRFESLSYVDVLDLELGVMDATAVTICKENAVPIKVFNLFTEESLLRVVRGEELGTWVR